MSECVEALPFKPEAQDTLQVIESSDGWVLELFTDGAGIIMGSHSSVPELLDGILLYVSDGTPVDYLAKNGDCFRLWPVVSGHDNQLLRRFLLRHPPSPSDPS